MPSVAQPRELAVSADWACFSQICGNIDDVAVTESDLDCFNQSDMQVGEQETSAATSVDDANSRLVGAVNQPTRRKPTNASVNAHQSI